MKKEQRKIPELRFPEFEEEWEVKKLGDLLTFKNGINASKEQYGHGVKFINVLDIINNNFITHDLIQGSVSVSEKEFAKNEVEYGDILFQRSSETREEVGQANVYLDKEQNATFGGFVIRGQALKPYNPVFMNFLLKTWLARKEITSKSGGSTRYNVGQDTLRSVSIFITNLQEQQKIAQFLTTIDTKIQQLTRKKALLQQYKKGAMQQIFSQQIRFKQDNGTNFPDWRERKLEEIVSFSKGRGIPKKDISENGSLKCIRYGELYTHYNEVIDNIRSRTNLDKTQLVLSEVNDVIIPTSGETQLDIATASCVLKSGVALGGDLTIIKSKLNGIFLAYYLSSAKKIDIARMSQGVSVIHLYSSHLKALKLQYPCLQEQQKIANFLTAIDQKINQVSQQITLTKNYKKGLLQQLFV